MPNQQLIALEGQLNNRVRHGMLRLLGGAAMATAGSQPKNSEAFDLYLRATALAHEEEPNKQAIAMLEPSVGLDPGYAPAWDTLGRLYYYDAAVRRQPNLERECRDRLPGDLLSELAAEMSNKRASRETAADRILDFLMDQPPFICDDCLSELTGIAPRQQVNTICRRLELEGRVRRLDLGVLSL